MASRSDALEKLAGMSVLEGDLDDGIAGKVADKDYSKLQRWFNVSSHSMLETLHQCPRKWQQTKQRHARGEARQNVDFAFGHAVGAGMASFSAHGDLGKAMFDAFLAWKIPYEAQIEKSKKSIWSAQLAVMKYESFKQEVLEDWEVWTLPDGRPAVELAVEIDFENGFKHYLHIDVILRNKYSGRFAVQENKTTSFQQPDEALYANSGQGTGYAAVVDMIHPLTSLEVLYTIYSSTSREWILMPFPKTVATRVEWINEVKFDHASLNTMRKIGLYPKRGNACFLYNRRCEFFGECGVQSGMVELKDLPPEESAEQVDFSFKISDMLARQAERI